MFRTRQIGQGVCWTESDMFSFEEAVTHPDGKANRRTPPRDMPPRIVTAEVQNAVRTAQTGAEGGGRRVLPCDMLCSRPE